MKRGVRRLAMRGVILTMIAAVVTLVTACPDHATSPPLEENTPPVLAAIGTVAAVAGESSTETLTATDDDGDALTFSIPTNPGFLSVANVSRTGNTTTASLVIAPGVYVTGSHDAVVRVTDGKGGADEQQARIEVSPPNQEPTATITAPADGASFVTGDPVTFEGGGTDPEDGTLTGSALVWTSDVDGALGTGASLTRSDLSEASHTITLTVTDSHGATDTAEVSITVAPNQEPTATITAPADGASFVTGDPVTLEGGGTDPEDGTLTGSALVWTSDVDGALGTGASLTRSDLSEFGQSIYLRVSDFLGATDTAEVSITVAPNQEPTATISAPADGASFPQHDAVQFVGMATDAEDGPLTGGDLMWTSSLDGQIGTGESFTRDDLSVGEHQIVLTATDSHGASRADTVAISVVQVPAQLSVSPKFAVLAPGEPRSMTVEVLDASGDPIPSPSLSSVCRDEAIATVSGTDVTGQAAGTTDCVWTSGAAEDSARFAVVAHNGFGVIASTSEDSYEMTAGPGGSLDVDLWLVRPPGGDGDLGAIQGSLSWDPNELTYVSSASVESGWTWVPNETNAASGTLAFAAFSATGTGNTFVLAQISFTASGASGGSTSIDPTITAAGDALGVDITALMQMVSSWVMIR